MCPEWIQIHFIFGPGSIFWFPAHPDFERPYYGFAIFDWFDLLQKTRKTLKMYIKLQVFQNTCFVQQIKESWESILTNVTKRWLRNGGGRLGALLGDLFSIAKHAAKGSNKWPQGWTSVPKRCPKVSKMCTTCWLWRTSRKQQRLLGPVGLREAVSEPRPGGPREAFTI